MVAFHDRRNRSYDTVQDLLPRLPLNEGDTLGKKVLDGRYVVRGEKTDNGREFVVHEVLANGRVVERGRADRRYKAERLVGEINPTSVYDI